MNLVDNPSGQSNLLWCWVHAIERLCAGHARVNFMTENWINIDDMSDRSLFLVALFHESGSFSCYQAQADDVRLHSSVQFDGIFGIQQKALGDDTCVVNQQVDSAAHILDPSEGGCHLFLITNIAFYALKVAFHFERLADCLKGVNRSWEILKNQKMRQSLTSILSFRFDIPQTIIPASTKALHNWAPIPTEIDVICELFMRLVNSSRIEVGFSLGDSPPPPIFRPLSKIVLNFFRWITCGHILHFSSENLFITDSTWPTWGSGDHRNFSFPLFHFSLRIYFK